ncbi:MAG TPA: oxygenase MpaB family protein [Candidatus Binatia bacterium]|nr:oxygenase MpaB family protein [Candidatus Binatia bacterium]
MALRSVSASDLERLLAGLSQSARAPAEGIFGPGSIGWKVNRESALFLAAGRAALLQLAHPWVAAAIAEHSRTFSDPVSRFHQTFRVMFTMSFGSVEQALAAARRLHRLHESIRGSLPETVGRFARGSPYRANEADALLWVYATLLDSSLLAYELVLPRLSDAERECYYGESRRASALYGIPPDLLPADWAGLSLYMESVLRSDVLGVSASTRHAGHLLQDGAGLPLRPPFWYRALTLQLLPARLRQEFQFDYGAREWRAADRALRWLRRIYPHLPAVLRLVGPYNEALARLKGRARPSLAVRMTNRMWVGQATLLHPARRESQG